MFVQAHQCTKSWTNITTNIGGCILRKKQTGRGRVASIPTKDYITAPQKCLSLSVACQYMFVIGKNLPEVLKAGLNPQNEVELCCVSAVSAGTGGLKEG